MRTVRHTPTQNIREYPPGVWGWLFLFSRWVGGYPPSLPYPLPLNSPRTLSYSKSFSFSQNVFYMYSMYKMFKKCFNFFDIKQHPSGCPCRFLTPADIANIPTSCKSRGVAVGVAVLLQSSDGHILLTRRAQHMRTFPSVWVPPGMTQLKTL